MAENELIPLSIIVDFGQARVKMYMRYAANAILVYDYFLTLDSEIALMWPSKMSVTKVLYFCTRYSAFSDAVVVLYYYMKANITVAECEHMDIIATWLITIGIIIAEVILMIRTWALWGRSKRMAIALITLSAGAIAAAAVLEGLYFPTRTFRSYPGSQTPGCFLVRGSPLIGVPFIIIIVVETVVLTLTVIPGFQRFRFAEGAQGSIGSVLYRDGVMFYVYLLAISLINFIVTFTVPAYSKDLMTGIQRALHSCLSARVLTNLREAGTHHGTSHLVPQSTVVFAARVVGSESTGRGSEPDA